MYISPTFQRKTNQGVFFKDSHIVALKILHIGEFCFLQLAHTENWRHTSNSDYNHLIINSGKSFKKYIVMLPMVSSVLICQICVVFFTKANSSITHDTA